MHEGVEKPAVVAPLGNRDWPAQQYVGDKKADKYQVDGDKTAMNHVIVEGVKTGGEVGDALVNRVKQKQRIKQQ